MGRDFLRLMEGSQPSASPSGSLAKSYMVRRFLTRTKKSVINLFVGILILASKHGHYLAST